MMMALLAANESSFIDQNINLVKAGAILRIPGPAEASVLTQQEALVAINEQNQLWRDYRDGFRTSSSTRLASSDRPQTNTSTSSDTATEPDALAANADVDFSELEGLSAEARAILEDARNEVQTREQLRIVADNQASSATASATADETGDNTAQRLGEVNRQLQLNREELASARLRTTDLDEQISELQDTEENLDSLVTLRQNEIARLESQLADTMAAESTESPLELGAANETTQPQAGAFQTAQGNSTDAGDTRSQAQVDEPAVNNQAQTAAANTTEKPWYKSLLDNPKRLIIAGVGGLGLLGILGTLLLFKRKRHDYDDEMLDAMDIEFVDDETPAAPDTQSVTPSNRASDNTDYAPSASASDDSSFDDFAGSEEADSFLSSTGADMDEFSDGSMTDDIGSFDDIDKDDTISEADVYLAYGLHGQAEELLNNAIERSPDNQAYSRKLLETYHAQGNADAFHVAAQDFHTRFNGESNAAWEEIAAMGVDMKPGDALYASAKEAVSTHSSQSSEVEATMDEDDFTSSSMMEEGVEFEGGSVNRDFSADDPEAPEDAMEEDLLDQSLDPAFAFDENDLEATGDFSQIADELSAETIDTNLESGLDDGLDDSLGANLEPSMESGLEDSLVDSLGDAPTDSIEESIDFPGLEEATADTDIESMTSMEQDIPAESDLDDSLSLGDLDGLSESSDDLTLDLDQLSGDMDLEGYDLLNNDVGDLDIPELTADNELLHDDTSGELDGDADEMDTMMDLAKAYIDMGDKDSASSALGEIVKSGNPEQVTEAETLLQKIS